MATGDFILFEEFDAFGGIHDFDTHVFKFAILDNTLAPTAADTTPALADYTQVGTAGNYVAGGATVTASKSEAAGVWTIDFTTNPTWAADASNDTDAYWGLLYNDTATGDPAIGFVELGGPVDMSAGSLTYNWHASGAFTATIP